MKLHENEIELISSNYQMALRKKPKMHIGFLVEESTPVNIALVADTSYAVLATVALHTIAKHSSRRLAFYIIDCGLKAGDKAQVRLSMAEKPNVSIVFISLGGESLAAPLGPAWAKLDLIDLLPVKRVLCLDADILAKGDVGRLWDTDLGDKLLGACPDVGFPLGHEGVGRGPYFNKGVLLMDLIKIRRDVQKLKVVAKSIPFSKFLDQDAMNIHFRGAWKPLNLEWNAQGLGIYAKCRTADKETVNLHEMANPTLVHFTGPVSPSLPLVLNPYVQPCTSKHGGT